MSTASPADGVRLTPNECPGYDIKLSNDKA